MCPDPREAQPPQCVLWSQQRSSDEKDKQANPQWFLGLDHECLDIWRVPPVLSDRDVRLVKTLRDMLSMKWRRSSRRGEGVSVMTFGMNQDMEWDHVLDVTLEGVPPPWVDMPEGKLVRHRCVGLCAFRRSDQVNCTSDACTRTLVCDAFCQCFTARSFGRFQTGRWTKTLPFLKKAGGAMLISPLFTTAVLKVQVAEHEERTRELAVRLGKLRQKASHPQFRFRLAVCLALTYYSDQIMEQHFFESASKYDKSDRGPGRVQHADDEDGGSREHKDRTGTWRIQHRVYAVLADIWKALKGRGREASALDVAMKFFRGSDFADRDSEMMMEVFTFIADVAIRFLREFQQCPESLAEFETSGDDDVWAAQAGVILDTPDCDLKEAAIQWKGGLQDVPLNRRGKWLRRRYLFWDATCTHCTRQEEDVHRKHRYAAQGHDSRPVSFTRQSMQTANASIAHEFCRLGGRTLSLPLPAIGRLFDAPKRTIHRRLASVLLCCLCGLQGRSGHACVLLLA